MLPNGVSTLAWSPDGSKIAFLSQDDMEPSSDPKVFPLAQERHQRLWIIRVNETIPQAVTPTGMTVWGYAWSPDGQRFAVYFSPRPDDTGWYHSQIGVVAADGGAIQQLTSFAPVSRQARALSWSPDGQHLAYISGKWSDPSRGAGDIFLLSLHNGQSRLLTPDIACSPTWCTWFPNGRQLLYTAVDGTITVLNRDFIMGSLDQPSLSTTPDVTFVAAIHSTSQQPPDVYRGQMEGEGDHITSVRWRRLTRLNPIAEETWLWATSQPIHYPSTVDGHLVHALFMPAVPEGEYTLAPLYVDVHGGPSGA